MRNITKTKRQQNQGFSLFTVLIAVSFVGILGLLVLYIALSNFNMKITDLKGKDSFYTAERALEEIRTGTAGGCGKCHVKGLYAGSRKLQRREPFTGFFYGQAAPERVSGLFYHRTYAHSPCVEDRR